MNMEKSLGYFHEAANAIANPRTDCVLVLFLCLLKPDMYFNTILLSIET